MKKVCRLNKQCDITIYSAKINFNMSDMEFQNSLSLLSSEEQYRILAKRTYKLRCEALTSICLAKKALKDALNLSKSSFEIKRDAFNRPYIKTDQRINADFNISHSNEYVVCAVSSNGRIGIDIEERLPIDINIAQEFLSIDELNSLYKDEENSLHLFYKYWTLKEAFFKAVGIGLNNSIRELDFGALNSSSIFSRRFADHKWDFYHSIFDESYSLSLAVDKDINSLKYKNVQ